MFSEIVHSAHFFHERSKQVLFLVVTLLIDIVSEVSLVLLLWVYESLDSVVASFHAELDTLVQDLLRLIRSVHISLGQRLDKLLLVVDDGIDDAITDRLGDDLLGLLPLEAELRSDVSHRDLRIRDVDLLETELDDSVLQTADQREDLISSKHSLIAGNQGIELVHLTLLDVLDD